MIREEGIKWLVVNEGLIESPLVGGLMYGVVSNQIYVGTQVILYF